MSLKYSFVSVYHYGSFSFIKLVGYEEEEEEDKRTLGKGREEPGRGSRS